MEAQVSFIVGLFLPLALAAGAALFVLAAIEVLISGITDFFNG